MLAFLFMMLLSVWIPFGMSVEETEAGTTGEIGLEAVSDATASALKNAATAMEVYYVENQTYDGATLQSLREQGLQVEEGVTVSIGLASGNRYCVEALAEGGISHYDSSIGTPELGPCR